MIFMFFVFPDPCAALWKKRQLPVGFCEICGKAAGETPGERRGAGKKKARGNCLAPRMDEGGTASSHRHLRRRHGDAVLHQFALLVEADGEFGHAKTFNLALKDDEFLELPA